MLKQNLLFPTLIASIFFVAAAAIANEYDPKGESGLPPNPSTFQGRIRHSPAGQSHA